MKNVFKDLLIIDTIRGIDSTGVLTVSKDNEVNTFKRAVDGFTFTDLKKYDKFMTKSLNPHLMLGHNRAATKGKINASNAHPFNDGNTHLVHNGTLVSYHALHRSTETDVDSEAICFQVEKSGIIDTVSKLHGAFTLASYDEGDQIFSIIRNSKRPMWLATVKNKDITIFASEPAFIQAAADRNEIELSTPPWCLKEQVLINFDLSDKRTIHSFEVNKDIEFYTPPANNYYRRDHGKKSGTVIPFLGEKPKTTSMTTIKNAKNSTAREARLNTVKSRLETLGVSMGEGIVGQVMGFTFFYGEKKKGDDGSGEISLQIFNPEDPTSSLQLISYRITNRRYKQLKDAFVFCKVLGIVDLSGKEDTMPVWVPVVSVSRELNTLEQNEFWDLFDWESSCAEDDTPQEQVSVNGKDCSLSHFKSRTKDGCCVCSNPIPVQDSDSLIWAMDEPLCKDCSIELAYKSKSMQLSIEELITH